MALCFQRAWELARAAAREAHHPQCSYVQTGGALLCDLACPVIDDAPEFRCPAFHGGGGAILNEGAPYGPCSCGVQAPMAGAR
jgi:hypothetical protein